MSRGTVTPTPRTLHLQDIASRPDRSAWVSANAGSGKTTVLVRRILRLLLAGVQPARILCLTYTKAGAATMANRLIARLGEWAALPEEALAAAVAKDLGRPPAPGELARARTLFAHALETPGGLKIDTIHGFCTRVLQSAPFEANVPARFELIEEAEQAEALDAALDAVIRDATDRPGELGAALAAIADLTDVGGFRELIGAALRRRDIAGDGGARPRDIAEVEAELSAVLGAEAARDPAELAAEALASLERALRFADLNAALCEHGTEAGRCAAVARLAEMAAACDDAGRLDIWCRTLLTAKDTPNSRLLTKAVVAARPDLPAAAEEAAKALLAGLDALRAAETYRRSLALHRLAGQVAARYAAFKARRGRLDYGDLIRRTVSLFARVESAWVLYRLDAGLDHVLVDEAQDTSADQWSIVDALTQELLAGADGRRRSLFAVGDEKQSIYGFQGAEPRLFAEQRRRLARSFAGRREADPASQGFEEVELSTSFRSVPEVLKAVDAVFARPEAFAGLSFGDEAVGTVHESLRSGLAGAVDLWDLDTDEPKEEGEVWNRPYDALDRQGALARMAARIAALIKRWTEAGRDDLGEPFDPGDVLILLPKRRAAFAVIVRALKNAGVPVAGLDRLKLGRHVAVEDMLAIARAALNPDDDLTLAIALKTPLLGLDDRHLEAIAPRREGALRAALDAAADPAIVAAARRFAAIEAAAATSGPFAFLAGLLAGGGRRAIVGRLGQEAGDALDELISRALDHERRHGPSLGRFVADIAGRDDDVKRDLATASGEVRVMTVHGAKGLEAPIVFIADVGEPPKLNRDGALIGLRHPRDPKQQVTAWAPRKELMPQAMREARAQAETRLVEEHHRLLYVAMTRAERRLILCGRRSATRDAHPGSWYRLAEAGLMAAEAEGALAAEAAELALPRLPPHPYRRFRLPGAAAAELAPAAPPAGEARPVELPGWALTPAPAEAATLPPLSPAGALDAADRPAREADPLLLAAAAAEGRLVHLLLQHLPGTAPERRAEVGLRLAAARAPAIAPDRRAELVAGAVRLIEDPAVAALFGPGSLPEAPLAGMVDWGGAARQVSGRIDRLAVTEAEVIIADFKTAARPPADAAAIRPEALAQLAIYAELVGRLFPGRRVRALLVYTAGPSLIEPGAERLAAALASAAVRQRT